MDIPCPKCGAQLRLNRNLAGTTVSCPRCAAPMTVPSRPPATARSRRAGTVVEEPGRKTTPFTLWLLCAQALIALLGLSCLAGAFLSPGWKPPEISYFQENPLYLMGAGIGLLLAGWMVSYLPVLTALGVAVFVLCVCGHNYVLRDAVDASRTIALMLAMLALWFALQHRRATAPLAE